MIDQAAAEQREQQAEEQRAARESAILALSADEEMSVATPSNLKETDVPAINGDRLTLGPIRDPEAQQRKTDLIPTASLSGVNPHLLQQPVSPYTLTAGTVIAAPPKTKT